MVLLRKLPTFLTTKRLKKKASHLKVKTVFFEWTEEKKESEVDPCMAYLMTKTLYDYVKDKENAVFIIASGDSDFEVPIKDVLENNVRVELWAWKNAMAGVYKEMAKRETRLLSIHYLDDHDLQPLKDIDMEHAICISRFDKKQLEKTDQENIFTRIERFGELRYYIDRFVMVVEFPQSNKKAVMTELNKQLNSTYHLCERELRSHRIKRSISSSTSSPKRPKHTSCPP